MTTLKCATFTLIFAFAFPVFSQTPALKFLDNGWVPAAQGATCEFTVECDDGENCMQGNQCFPVACDDTHLCTLGEICDQGICHIK